MEEVFDRAIDSKYYDSLRSEKNADWVKRMGLQGFVRQSWTKRQTKHSLLVNLVWGFNLETKKLGDVNFGLDNLSAVFPLSGCG